MLSPPDSSPPSHPSNETPLPPSKGVPANGNDPPKPGHPTTADDALPPVAPPDAAFLLQLFLIPMIIVSIVVMVWLLFSWLARMGNDPKELVRDLKVLNEASWQKANTLSDMLRNREYDYLKDDAELAAELASLLDSELDLSGRRRETPATTNFSLPGAR